MSKISLQMYTMREHTKTLSELDNTVGKLGEMGFKNLQYSIPAHFDSKEVKKIFDKNSMKNDSVFCPWLQLEERAGEVLLQAEMFETAYVRIEAIPYELANTAAGYKAYAHALNELAQPYKKEGIKILYHFHAFEFIRFDNTRGIDIFLKETDPEVIQLNPDTHWIHSGGQNICDFMEKYKDRYDYIHTKDFGIGERGATLEARPIVFAPVGAGNLDWKPVIDLCKRNQVKIYAIEQDDCYGADPFVCVKTSFDNLKKLGVDE